jgi:hypothetical protein
MYHPDISTPDGRRLVIAELPQDSAAGPFNDCGDA